MAPLTAAEVDALPPGVQNAVRRPSTFLSLAPATSASYPGKRTSPPASIVSPKIAAVDAPPAATEEATPAGTVARPAAEEATELNLANHRRSSSMASDDSGNFKLRFLKLGPVHWGEGDGDWSDVGVTE